MHIRSLVPLNQKSSRKGTDEEGISVGNDTSWKAMKFTN